MTETCALPIYLFNEPKTMKERILRFAKHKGFITSKDLDDFHDYLKTHKGHVKGLLRIHREAKDLASLGKLRRLDDKEKLFRGMEKRFATYEYVKKEE